MSKPGSTNLLPRRLRTALAILSLGLTATVAGPVSGETADDQSLQPTASSPATPTLIQQYEQRRADCPPGDVRAELNLGIWCEEQRLLTQADAAYRTVLGVDPDHPRAFEGVVRISLAISLPKASDSLRFTRERLGIGFRTFESGHFVLLSNAPSNEAMTELNRLERTHHQFNRFTQRLGVEPHPMAHKLVAVLFADRAEYQAFARQSDEVGEPWIAGYYAPRYDRVVFYQGQANPSVVKAERKLDAMQEEVDDLDRQRRLANRAGREREAEALAQQHEQYRAHLRRERARVQDFINQTNIATVTHEAAHQLLFHTGIQSSRLQYPIWISEGLATAFETDVPGSAFGPDHEYPPRRDAFRVLLVDETILPLHTLITITEPPSNDDMVHVVYHQSYALVTWLFRFRRAELGTYLNLLRHETGALDAPQHVSIFQDAFGSIETLERTWRAHERGRLLGFAE